MGTHVANGDDMGRWVAIGTALGIAALGMAAQAAMPAAASAGRLEINQGRGC